MYAKFPLHLIETSDAFHACDASQPKGNAASIKSQRVISTYNKVKMGYAKALAYAKAYVAMSNRTREIFTD